MEKLFLATERKMFSCTAWNSKKIPHWTETNLSALHFKTSLQSKRCHCFYLHLWLVLGKNTQPSMAIMTVYRAVFCILPLDNSITSLSTGWPGQQRQISVWVHVNQWKLQLFCKKLLGPVHTYPDIFEKGDFFSVFKKYTSTHRVFELFLPVEFSPFNIFGRTAL